MKSIFLSSYFTEVKDLFAQYVSENKGKKVVTFIPTAANPEEVKFHVHTDMKSLEEIGFRVETIDISVQDEETIAKQIAKNDYLFVSGGNTFYLLQEMKKKKVDAMIREFIAKGKTYIGSSAGSVVLSKNIGYIEKMDDTSMAAELVNYDSIGMIDFFILPHYTCEPFAEVADEVYKEYKGKIDIRPITNKQAIVSLNNEYVVVQSEVAND